MQHQGGLGAAAGVATAGGEKDAGHRRLLLQPGDQLYPLLGLGGGEVGDCCAMTEFIRIINFFLENKRTFKCQMLIFFLATC